jgi:hypothetical protein
LFKSKIELFIAKRALIFFIVLAISDIIFIAKRWLVLEGLALGGIFSILKFGSYVLVLTKTISPVSGIGQQKHGVRNSVLIFIVNQIILLPLLFISLKINQWFFAGIVAGILLVPLVLFINCITEPLKITHNNFE